jgi:two-component system sensor histidine kinase UhpB
MPNAVLTTQDSTLKIAGKISYLGKPVSDTILNGFITVDRNWVVIYWNKAAEKLLGIEARNILGKNLWSQFAATLPVEFYQVYDKAFTNDIPVHFEEYWGEMGGWFNVITYYSKGTLSVSFKNSNQPFAYPQDQSIKRFEALSELYKLVTEVTNDCLWEWNFLTDEVFWIDGGHQRVFGYPIQNALIPSTFWEDRVHPEDKVRMLASIEDIKKGKPIDLWEAEYRFKKSKGDYAFVHDRGHIVYDENSRPIRMVGATQDITKKVSLQNEVIEKEFQHRREVTSAILTAQEKERSAVGQELHDNLNQILVVAKMYIQMSEMNTGKRKEFIDRASECITDVVQQIRIISKNLAVPDTHISGLSVNIESLLGDLLKVQPIKIDFINAALDESLLEDKIQLTLFRITQEQLHNILKHSGATEATITLKTENKKVYLEIEDNGNGCDLTEKRKGVGLINIGSRADIHNGTVNRVSTLGKGYKLEVSIPLVPVVKLDNTVGIAVTA